ncbi:E3 ubiquitin-protein ligase [Thalictrum thalictroides]|uniref:E3 ubiquitin-protein ligase n=1 Tax=Thalictrum thalictroides TaxID=46969 RepID=A0A7J6W8Z6_THATH|nr:E3 ubiquitin-protein ligase [Thalictrum thalictroides]
MALDVQHKQQQPQLQQNHVLGCVGAHHQCYTTHISSSSVFNFDLNLSHHHHHKPAVVVPVPITLDLFHTQENASSIVELDEPSPLPFGWQKCLNLKTGEIYYTKEKRRKATNMSRNGKNPRLDLKLNLSPPRAGNQQVIQSSPNRSSTSSPISPPSSCVSSELNNEETLRYSNSPEATSMVLVGCPRCLMYVMLSEEDPKCPKCKSTVLLDFVHDNNTKKTKKQN